MRWVFNRSDKDRSVTVSIDNAVGYDIYDPLSGVITYVEGAELELEIPANNARIIVAKLP
jgi:hypothetical protein